MKILLATSKAVPSGGGIASYNQELIKALDKGNDFFLMTSANEHDVIGFKKTESLYGVDYYDFKVASNIIEIINNQKYGLIINSNSEFIAVATPFLNAPIISVSHFVNGLLADCAGYNSTYINNIIALSNYGKLYLDNKFKINDKDKVKVVYNFVHRSSNAFKKEKNEIIKIVYPGGTSVNKSFDVVMAVAYLLKRSNLNFSFYWLGNTTLPSSNLSLLGVRDIRQMIHDDDRFIITGNVKREEAEQIISSANIFLLPSRGEGCPMTLLEAMRDGCIPIVSDAHHGSRELIENSKAGFIIKQGDEKAIVSLIIDVILYHEKYYDFYNKTREFSETNLSPEIWTNHMNSIILEALTHPKRCIELDESLYNYSVSGFKKLIKKERRNKMINSALNRLKMDWLYLKWKGWR